MIKEELILLNVSQLQPYCEFDRLKNPAPKIPFFHETTVLELVEDIKKFGLKEPLELSVYKNTCLLTDGNHRLAALRVLKRENVKTRIVYYETMDDLLDVYYYHPHVIERLKPINTSLINIINALR